MVRRSPDPRTEKDGLDREVRASSFVQGAMREGLPTSFVADGLSGRIRSYGERYFESPGLIEALTGGMLANSLLRPTSVSVRRWVAENIDALDRDDASVVLALSVIDSVEIEEALARSLPHGRTEGLAWLSDYERGWVKHLAADMRVAVLRSLVASAGKPKISAMLDDVAVRLATGDVAEVVRNLLAGSPTP